jgi:two-component system, cell cycle sensor histidine kinase and response regulator CckA
MAPTTRVLIVEDLPTDAELAQREIEKTLGSCEFRRVETREQYLAALDEFRPTLIVSDFKLPAFDGLTALMLAIERAPETPFIVLTGSMNEDTAVECMKAGAWDYVIKEHVKRLGSVILGALEEKRVRDERRAAEAALRESEARHRTTLQTAMDGFWRVDLEGRLLEVNQAYWQMSGYTERELLAMNISDLEAVETPADTAARIRGLVTRGEQRFESRHRRKDGSLYDVEVRVQYKPANGGECVAFLHDITHRKRAEEELRFKAILLSTQMEASNDGILVVDDTGTMLSCNRRFAEIWGIPPDALASRSDEVLLRSIMDKVSAPADFLNRVRNLYVHPKETSQDEIPLRDGRILERYTAPMVGDDGTYYGRVWYFHDITERRRALDETRALLHATRAVADDPDFQRAARAVFDVCRELVGASAGWVALLSKDPQQNEALFLETGGLACTVDPELPMLVRGLRARAYKSETAIYDNVCPENPSRRFVPEGHVPLTNVLLAPLRIGGRTSGLLGLANKPGGFNERDARLAEAFSELIAVALRNSRQIELISHSEERYRTLIENLEHVVFSTDSQGRFTYVSSAIARYGLTSEEVVGQTARELRQFIHPDDLAGFEASIARTLAGHVEPCEFRVIDKTGRIHFIRGSSRPVRVLQQVVGLGGVLVDRTTQQEMEEQLWMARKMEAVGRLAGGVAHDFNNILSVILSYAEFGVDATRDGDPLREDLQEIRTAAERAATLTRQLLAFSRRQVLRPEVLDLNVVVGDTEKMLGRMIGEDIDLMFRPEQGLWATKADRGQIEQVVMNLALNARDAMPNGGKLTIETANVELDEDYAARHIGATPGPCVMLAITDTGDGMDAETQARLFEPFFTTKPVGKGTGLGLATVYGIVKQSGGSIWVYSEVGRGTTFRIYLPRCTDAAEVKPPVLSVVGPTTGSETILVVEDEAALRSLAQRILAASGYKVFTAANGWEALRLCEGMQERVDLMLTDVIMPGMSGRELAERLTQAHPQLKVVYMSGYTGNGILHQGVLDPEMPFVEKPFRGEELMRRVRETLDGVAMREPEGDVNSDPEGEPRRE